MRHARRMLWHLETAIASRWAVCGDNLPVLFTTPVSWASGADPLVKRLLAELSSE